MEITKWADAQELMKTGVVYLQFWAEWCSYCLKMDPIVERVVRHFQNRKGFKFIRVNEDETNFLDKAPNRYQVVCVPTNIILKNNQIIHCDYENTTAEMLIE